MERARTSTARRFCVEALGLQRERFRLRHRFRADPRARGNPLTRPELIAKGLPIEERLFALAVRHVNTPTAEVRNLAQAVFH